jgi:hypothetical protein
MGVRMRVFYETYVVQCRIGDRWMDVGVRLRASQAKALAGHVIHSVDKFPSVVEVRVVQRLENDPGFRIQRLSRENDPAEAGPSIREETSSDRIGAELASKLSDAAG